MEDVCDLGTSVENILLPFSCCQPAAAPCEAEMPGASKRQRSASLLVSQPRRYSVRRALIGEIEAARPAGMIAAKKAQIASAPAATLSAIGSQNDMP